MAFTDLRPEVEKGVKQPFYAFRRLDVIFGMLRCQNTKSGVWDLGSRQPIWVSREISRPSMGLVGYLDGSHGPEEAF